MGTKDLALAGALATISYAAWISLSSLLPKHVPSSNGKSRNQEYISFPVCKADIGPRNVFITYGFVVPSRLDSERLRDALVALADYWPNISSRLGMDQQGNFVFLMPRAFSGNVPPFSWSSVHFAELYSASTSRPPMPAHLYATVSSKPIVIDAPSLISFFRDELRPHTLRDLLENYSPLLEVRVTTFEDVTFVGVTSTHLFADALGISALLTAWMSALNGDFPGAETISPLGSPEMASWGSESPLPHNCGAWYRPDCLERLSLRWGRLLKLWIDPVEEMKLLTVPKASLAEWTSTVRRTVSSETAISSSDVLTAWLTKALNGDAGWLSRDIYINIPVDIRSLVPELHNKRILSAFDEIAVAPIPARSSVKDMARAIRTAVERYRSSFADIRRSVGFKIASFDSVALRGWWLSWREPYLLMSNWRSARFAQLDWSSASLFARTPDRSSSPGGTLRAAVILPYIETNGQAVRGLTWIAGEDEQRIWVNIVLGRRAWRTVLRNLITAGVEVM